MKNKVDMYLVCELIVFFFRIIGCISHDNGGSVGRVVIGF